MAAYMNGLLVSCEAPESDGISHSDKRGVVIKKNIRLSYEVFFTCKLFYFFEKEQYYPRSFSAIPLSLHGIGHLFVIWAVSHPLPARSTISPVCAFRSAHDIASSLLGII